MRVRLSIFLLGTLFLSLTSIAASLPFANAQTVINEVFYAPSSQQKENEFIELFLFDPTLDLSNYTLKIGTTTETLTPAAQIISPYALIVADTSNITATNASIYRVNGALGNTGMSSTTAIQLFDDFGILLEAVNLSSFPPTKTNYSLERMHPNASLFSESLVSGGTPGIQNSVFSSNNPPVLQTIGDQTVFETQPLTIQLSAFDPENDTLLFATDAAAILPSPFTFDNTTGIFTWVPTYTGAGNYSVTFNVTDGTSWDAETILISVLNLNRAPLFSPLGQQSIFEDTSLTLNLSQYAVDPDGDVLTFSASSPLDNITLTINQTTSIVTLVPDPNFFGSLPIVFTARDQTSASASILFFDVISVNDAPKIHSTPSLTVQQDDLYTYNIVSTDADGDPLTLSLPLAPTGMTLSSAGNITWTPTSTQVAPTQVHILVTDPFNASATQNFTLIVTNKNDPPRINSTPITTATQDIPYVYQATADDPDLSFGDVLTFTLQQAPQGMAIDAKTGLIAWVPQISQVSSHPIVLTVRDSAGLTDTQSFTIHVMNVNDPPTQPILVNPPLGAFLRDPSVTLQWNASTDPDNDSVSYYVVTGKLVNQGLNATNVTVIQTSSLQHTIALEDNTTYGWGVIATDGVLNASTDLYFFFSSFFNPPRIQIITPSTLTPTIQENTTLAFAVNVTDPDGDPVVSVDWYLDTQLQTSGNAFTYAPSFNDQGVHNVTVIATDNTSRSSFASFTVTVLDANRNPDLAPLLDQIVTQGAPLTFSLNATDPDLLFRDVLTYTASHSGFTIIKRSETSADVSFISTNNDVGAQRISFTVTDRSGATDTESFLLTVLNSNDPPSIISSPTTQAVINIPYTTDILATDPDLQFGDTLTFSLATGPAGMNLTQIDATTGRINWTPSATDFGQHQILVRVTDSFNASATQAYRLDVAQTGNGTFVILDQFSPTKPTFGDENQQASNSRSDETSEKNIFDTTPLRIQNSGPSTISQFTLFVTPLPGFSSQDLNISLQSAPNTLAKGASSSLVLRARIPEQLAAVDQKNDPNAIAVADITLEARDPFGAPIRTTFRAYMQRENELVISDTAFFVNDKSGKSIDDGDDVEDLKPKDRLAFEVTAENTYDESANLDLNDVRVQLDCDNAKEFEFDETQEDLGDLGDGNEESTTLTFLVEEDAADSDSSCTLVLSGKDDHGALHAEALTFTLNVERESHDLQIENLEISPDVIRCETQNINVRADIRNLGKSDESDAVVEVISKDLNYQLRTNTFELDEDNVQELNILIPLPQALSLGRKTIQIKTLYDSSKASNSETIFLENQCGARATIPTRQQQQPTTTEVILTLGQSSLTVAPGDVVSIPVRLTHTGERPRVYTVTTANIEEFAAPSPQKSVLLKKGQTATLYVNLPIKENASLRKQSATIVIATEGNIATTDTITLDITGKRKGSGNVQSTFFWIIINLLAILLVLFLVDKYVLRKKDTPRK